MLSHGLPARQSSPATSSHPGCPAVLVALTGYTSVPVSSCFGPDLLSWAPRSSVPVLLPSLANPSLSPYQCSFFPSLNPCWSHVLPFNPTAKTRVLPSKLRHSPEDAFGLSHLLSSSCFDSSSWEQEVNAQRQHPELSWARSTLHVQLQW